MVFSKEMPKKLQREWQEMKGKMLTLVVLPQDSINANSQKRNGKVMGGDKNGQKISTGKF